jgi:predicted MFS family arabinose efflux permease
LRRILVAYTVNRLGSWFGLLALMLAVFDRTHSALAVAALLLAWQALPAFVVPAVVARVEASRRGAELSGLYFFEALATAALALLLLRQFWLPGVLLLAALDGTAALAASALLRTEVARVARDEVDITPTSDAAADDRESQERSMTPPARPVATAAAIEDAAHEAERKANAALNVAFSASCVAGPVLGGVAVAAFGAPTALFIDVGSFVVCGVLLIDLHPHVTEAGGDSVRERVRAAWRHIKEAPSLRGILAAEVVAFVCFEAAAPIEVTYAKATLHAGDRGFGLLLSAWGAGTVLGSLLFARSLRSPLGLMLSAGTLGVGLAYVGFAAAPSLAIACIVALAGGVGNGVELPSLFSVVQRLTPPNLHGRLMGAVESISAACVAVGLPLGGALVALSSPRAAFLVVGLGAVAASAALLRLGRVAPESPEHGDLDAVGSASGAGAHVGSLPGGPAPE